MKIKLLLLLLSLPLFSMAQLKQFTLEDLIPGGKNYHKMSPTSWKTFWWGNTLLEQKGNDIFQIEEGKKATPLFSLSDINEVLLAKSLPQLSEIKNPRFPDKTKAEVLLINKQTIFTYNWIKKELTWSVVLPEGISDGDFNEISRTYAYNRKNNLFLLTPQGKEIQLSEDGSRDIVYGQSVHRNEFGIVKGTFWSPDGNSLCYYRMDQSMVKDYPLVDISTRIATLNPEKYPMAGETSHKVSIGIYHQLTNKTIWLQTGDNTDQYYSGITWSPDSKKLFLYNINREQNHIRLLQFNAETGMLEKEILEMKHPKYIDPQYGIFFLPWDSDRFLYYGADDNIYIYSLKQEKVIRTVTSSKLGIVIDLLGFNAKNKSVILCTTGCKSMQHNLFNVNLEKEKVTLLDEGEGVHNGILSPDGSKIADTWSSPQVPRKIDILSSTSPKIRHLHVSANPWQGYNVPEISSGTLKAADGTTDLYYRLIKPAKFNPQKKYPTIIYVYGGPHARMVTSSFGYQYRGWEIYMAQLGYLVFVMDNRGSSERGLDFENVTFRQLGKIEMEDQMKGVEYLKSLPYVDSNRLGIHGWSYGGFMTINLMLTYPDVFKCGVAGGPVIDWKYYEVMYGERYMDTPENNPDGYKASNLNLRAGHLRGRLEIIFGYQDPTCVPQHSLSFIRACEDAGTHPDLFIYPGQEHNMFGRDRIHLHEHITRYFEDHLK